MTLDLIVLQTKDSLLVCLLIDIPCKSLKRRIFAGDVGNDQELAILRDVCNVQVQVLTLDC